MSVPIPDRTTLKELIAARIFDYEESEDYVRPSEGDCHAIAEDIISLIARARCPHDGHLFGVLCSEVEEMLRDAESHTREVEEELVSRINEARELRQQIKTLTDTLNHARAWCEADRDDEDGYPTQEMFENRVDIIDEGLGKAGAK